MNVFKFFLVSGLVASISFSTLADTENSLEQLKATMSSKLGLEVSTVKKAPIGDLYEVATIRGIFYTSLDGRYIIRGNLYDADQDFKDLTQVAMREVMAPERKKRVAKLVDFENSMITYPAKDEKYSITVFTDVDCGYCRKLHAKMPQYNALGITVRYLAFPRGGERSQAWRDMQSLWCSADQRKAMDELKAGSDIAQANCPNRVPEHYNLGIEFGVTGTPAIILDDGTMIPGYQEPRQLLNVLKG